MLSSMRTAGLAPAAHPRRNAATAAAPQQQQQPRLPQQRNRRCRLRRGPAPAGAGDAATSSSSSAGASAARRVTNALVAAEHTVADAVSHALPGGGHRREGEEEDSMTEATVTEEVEVVVAVPVAARAAAAPAKNATSAESLVQRAVEARDWAVETGFASALAGLAAAGLAATLAVAVGRQYRRANSPRAVRRRVLDRNRALVEALREYLPDRRAELTPSVASKIRARSGFTPVEVFRKFLWYLLRDRRFDGDAVADAAALKEALALTDEQASEALRERADRIYEKYGTLMLGADAQGLSAAGIERKAACRALFAKMLYLAETGALVGGAAAAGGGRDDSGRRAVFTAVDLRDVFGATEEDVDAVRIASLNEEGAVERLEEMMGRARHAQHVAEEAGMAEEEAIDAQWREDEAEKKKKKGQQQQGEGGGGEGEAVAEGGEKGAGTGLSEGKGDGKGGSSSS